LLLQERRNILSDAVLHVLTSETRLQNEMKSKANTTSLEQF